MTFVLSDRLINSKLSAINSASYVSYTQSINNFTQSINNWTQSVTQSIEILKGNFNFFTQSIYQTLSSSTTLFTQSQYLVSGKIAINFTGSAVKSASLSGLTASIFLETGSGGVSSSYHAYTLLSQSAWLGFDDFALNFTGSGVTASINNHTASILINGGAGSPSASYHAFTLLTQSQWFGYDDWALDFTGSVQVSKANGTASVYIPPGVLPPYAKVLIVDPSGSDTSGQRGQIDKPFLSPSGARSQALADDLIIVNPGVYTSSINLAKEGVNWYWHLGSELTASAGGGVFDSYVNNQSKATQVLGYGSFYKTGGSGSIFTNSYNTSSAIFSCKNAINWSGSVVVIYASSSLWVDPAGLGRAYIYSTNLIETKNTSSNAIDFYHVGYEGINAVIDVNDVRSINGDCFYLVNSFHQVPTYAATTVKANHVYSSGGAGFDMYDIDCTIIASTIYGGTAGIRTAEYAYGTIQCSNINSFIGNASYARSQISVYGNIGTVTINGAGQELIGFPTVNHATLYNGYTELKLDPSGYNWSVYGGSHNLKFENFVYGNFYFGGGKTLIDINCIQSAYKYYPFYVYNTASVSLNGTWHTGASLNGSYPEMFTLLDSASLSLKGTFKNGYSDNTAHVVKKSGESKLIINDAILIVQTGSNAMAINCPTTSSQNVKIHYGGSNYTGSIFTNKKQKEKWTITTAGIPASMSLSDGSGASEVFSETDVATYNTKPLMAQRIASLINASATLDITATQDNPGTDNYFYIEADVAGVLFTETSFGWSNMSGVTIQQNHLAPVNILPGVWMEDYDYYA